MIDFKMPSGKEAVILDLLASGREMYGLQMVNTGVGLGRNTIYVILGRMVERGLVSTRTESDARSPGMPRRLYRITGLGQRALRAHNSAEGIFGRTLARGVAQ